MQGGNVMQKAFNVSETITFTTQVGASTKGEARKKFIAYIKCL